MGIKMVEEKIVEKPLELVESDIKKFYGLQYGYTQTKPMVLVQ